MMTNNKATAFAITLATGAAAWYMYPKKPAALKPTALNPAAPDFVRTCNLTSSYHSLTHQIPKSMTRSKSPALIVTNIKIDPVTGEPKITPPNQTVHKAPDVYGEVAPGGPALEISEEHSKQKIKDAEEEEEMAEALKRENEEDKRAMTAEEGRKHGFLESQWSSDTVAVEDGAHIEGVRTEIKNVWREVEGESDSGESGGEPESSVSGPNLPGMYESND